MVAIIPPQDPFSGPLAQNIARAAQAFAGNQFQKQKLQQQQQIQKNQGRALGQLLKSTDPERFGNLDLDVFSNLSPQANTQIARNAFAQKSTGQPTKSQLASQINKLADTEVKEILNNFRGPLGEIRLTGKEGNAAKKAIRKINQDREKKLKAIFGEDLPGMDTEELDVVSKFLNGDFTEIPEKVVKEKGGFFQGLKNFISGSSDQNLEQTSKSDKKGKPLTDQDKKRIADVIKKKYPDASRDEKIRLATELAKEEGFEF